MLKLLNRLNRRLTTPLAYGLRPALAGDYDFIYGTARTTMRGYVAQIWGWDEQFQQERFASIFHADEWQVLTVDGHDAGALSVQRDPSMIFLSNIYILPPYQRHGIGRRIITGLQDEAQEHGVPLRLNVLTSNAPAFRLYQKLGFHVVERSPEKLLMST